MPTKRRTDTERAAALNAILEHLQLQAEEIQRLAAVVREESRRSAAEAKQNVDTSRRRIVKKR